MDELQQLGLPREHSNALGKAYSEQKLRAVERLRDEFIHQKGQMSFRRKTLHNEQFIVVSAAEKDFVMGPGQAQQLLDELKQARCAFDSYA